MVYLSLHFANRYSLYLLSGLTAGGPLGSFVYAEFRRPPGDLDDNSNSDNTQCIDGNDQVPNDKFYQAVEVCKCQKRGFGTVLFS